MAQVYLHLARELDLPTSPAAAEAFQMSVYRWPAFSDSVSALQRLRKRFRLVAMTNADRAAFSFYAHTLGNPFHDSVTADETGCAKPDPQFFAFNRGRQSAFGYKLEDILHVAQSQHHDIGIAKSLGYRTCWIERRQGQRGFGGTPAVARPPSIGHQGLMASVLGRARQLLGPRRGDDVGGGGRGCGEALARLHAEMSNQAHRYMW
jgi:putative hydrolase of the HAD superfamily